ncbi:histone deacetylase family protein [Planctomicrobium sp. SH664]|uniref:histone deacetylase family protein n=1 Tax=Planctomicrobium sp. SH664 TaxID=3448125 RepID=UPI003F5B9744
MLLYSDPVFQQHDPGPHPENPQRLQAIQTAIAPLLEPLRIQPGTLTSAPDEDLLAVHTAEYLQELIRTNDAGGGRLDPDTVMSSRSLAVARLAAGTACEAVRQVLQGPVRRALCLTRPPGHHALAGRAMGFCLFNNIAVAARFAQKHCGVERILIVDWDVHHGNGTQDLFYDDGQIVFFSMHRDRFWPGTGHAHETGTGLGLGATLNAPIPYGTPRETLIQTFEAHLQRAVQRARPELILLSAGFDAHRLDPIGSLGLETEDFGRLTEIIRAASNAECQGRLVSLLEGGYSLEALGESVALHLQTLAEQPPG